MKNNLISRKILFSCKRKEKYGKIIAGYRQGEIFLEV